MRSSLRPCLAQICSAVAVAAALTACGGATSRLTSPVDASVPVEAGQDGGVPGDANADANSIGDADAAASSDDAGEHADAGADAAACDESASRKDCVACCDARWATGLTVFDTAVEECACSASLCGALTDGGGPNDSGDLGTGACTGTCGSAKPIAGFCEKCALETLGTVADAGPCRASVATVCGAGTACGRYVACTDSCAALGM